MSTTSLYINMCGKYTIKSSDGFFHYNTIFNNKEVAILMYQAIIQEKVKQTERLAKPERTEICR